MTSLKIFIVKFYIVAAIHATVGIKKSRQIFSVALEQRVLLFELILMRLLRLTELTALSAEHCGRHHVALREAAEIILLVGFKESIIAAREGNFVEVVRRADGEVVALENFTRGVFIAPHLRSLSAADVGSLSAVEVGSLSAAVEIILSVEVSVHQIISPKIFFATVEVALIFTGANIKSHFLNCFRLC